MSRNYWNIIIPSLLLVISLIFVGTSIFDLIARIDFYKKLDKKVVVNEVTALGEDASYRSLSLVDYATMRREFFVVDVRESEEFEQGHLIDSINYRLGDIVSDDEFVKRVVNENPEDKILLFCHDGERSRIVAGKLYKEGRENIFIVEGGFSQLRSDDSLKDEIWTGKTSRVLPGDFWDDLRSRGYRSKVIETEIVVDVCNSQKDLSGVAPDSEAFHFPLMVLSTSDVEKGLRQIGSDTITIVCDDKVSCFYAKLLAYRVERQGGKFSGYFYWEKNN